MLSISENTILINENEVSERLYKVVHGSFAMYFNYGKEDEFLVGVLSKGKCFGEIGFLSGERNPFTVVALEDSVVLDISEENLKEFIVNNPGNAIDIMKSMSHTVCLLEKHLNMVVDEINEKDEKKKGMTKKLMENIQRYKMLNK